MWFVLSCPIRCGEAHFYTILQWSRMHTMMVCQERHVLFKHTQCIVVISHTSLDLCWHITCLCWNNADFCLAFDAWWEPNNASKLWHTDIYCRWRIRMNEMNHLMSISPLTGEWDLKTQRPLLSAVWQQHGSHCSPHKIVLKAGTHGTIFCPFRCYEANRHDNWPYRV